MSTKNIFENKLHEKLKNFKATPPADAWDNISSRLDKTKPAIPFWKKWPAIAASVLILVLASYGSYHWMNSAYNSSNSITNNSKISNNTAKNGATVTKNSSDNQSNKNNSQGAILNTENDKNLQPLNNNNNNNNNNNTNTNNTSFVRSDSDNKSNNNNNNQNNSNYYSSNSNNFNNDYYNQPTDNNLSSQTEADWVQTLPDFSNEFALNGNINIPDQMALNNFYYTPIENVLDDLKIEDVEEKKESKKAGNFTVSSFVSPNTFASFDGASLLSSKLNTYGTKNNMTMGYGAKVAYALNNKLSVRTGVGVIGVSQQTNHVPISLSANESSNGKLFNVNYNSSLQITNTNIPQLETLSLAEIGEQAINGRTVDITQDVQYIEVPVEVIYKVYGSKPFDLNLSTGMSTLILDGNKITVNNEKGNSLGEASNLESLSFSANLGVKMDVNVTPRIQLNVEPQFKYLINSVSENDELKPYVIGINGGISYSF